MNTKVAKKNNKGFTLIELIVVIAIIAVLAAILAPQYLRYVEKSRVSADESSAKEIISAAQTACAEESVYEAVADANGGTVEWDKDNGLQNVVPTALNDEITKTLPSVGKIKSKKYRAKDNGVFTVTITATDDGTVTVTNSWNLS